MPGPRAEDWLARHLVAVAGGDRDAFASLYAALFPQLRSVAAQKLRDRGQAEDVAQEVMIELLTKAGSFQEGRGSARGWVMTIVRRRTVDRIRNECRTQRCEQYAAGMEPAPAPETAQQNVERCLERDEVRWGLGELTPLQREAIRLAYYDGHSYREVASRLGVPVGTAKSRIRDGLAALRRALADSAHDRAGAGRGEYGGATERASPVDVRRRT